MRILYFADIRFPLERANGIQTIETCYALAERGHQVDLVVRPDTHTPARDPFEYYNLPRHPGFVIEHAPMTGGRLPALARRVGYLSYTAGRAMGSGRADVVMTRDLTVAWLLLHMPGHAPLVFESHGYAPDVAAALPQMVSTASAPRQSKLDRLARREAYVWAHAEGYVTITAGLAAALTERFGSRERIAVVPDGVRLKPDTTFVGSGFSRTSPVGSGFSRTDDQPIVGYAGHLYPWKGVDTLLEALAQVPSVRALIVGGHEQESDLSRVRSLAERLGIAPRVEFVGYVAPSQVPAHLSRADVLALPNPPSAISTHATSPLKLFEYMAAGRAIVASDLPAIREVLTHDVNAWLVRAGDAAALADGIRHLATDRARRQRLASAALAAIAEYSWSRRAERLESLFADMR